MQQTANVEDGEESIVSDGNGFTGLRRRQLCATLGRLVAGALIPVFCLSAGHARAVPLGFHHPDQRRRDVEWGHAGVGGETLERCPMKWVINKIGCGLPTDAPSRFHPSA